MDNKTWIWRKKSSEKTIIPPENSGRSMTELEEEREKLSKGTKGGPFLPARNLNEKLASVLLDCHAKEDLAIIPEEWEQEYAADQEMENAEAVCLKKKLDEALKQGAAANEKLVQTEAALKQCIKQLSLFQRASEQMIDNAVTMPSSEHEKSFKVLEDELKETSKRLANVVVENTNLSKALLVKEKLVEELQKHVSQKSAESNILMAKLDSKEKENAFFKYKFHMLEKELEVRNEELEYNRRSIDALHMQHLESVQKISKLESECQSLRGQTKKRLPGPSALTKMRNQVDGSGWNGRKSNPIRDLMLRDSCMEKPPVLQLENKNIFIERMSTLEEETKVLKKLLAKKNAELQSSRMMFSRTASRLSQVEAQLIEHTGSRKLVEQAHCSQVSNQLSPMAVFDLGSDDGISSSGSWANALITELDHFREEKLKSPLSQGATEMSLMDDFVEVEKLAMVSTQAPFLDGKQTLSSGKELVLVVQEQSGSANDSQEIHHNTDAIEEPFDWLQDVLKAISKQQRISKRSASELIQDIKIALGCLHDPKLPERHHATMTSGHFMDSNDGGRITWKSPNVSSIFDLRHASANNSSVRETIKQQQPSLSTSMHKIIGLVEGLKRADFMGHDSNRTWPKKEERSLSSAVSAEYFVRVFQWRSSELSYVLQRFVHSCNGLVTNETSLPDFAEDLYVTLEWIMSNYVTPKEASSTREKIKRHFGWNDPQNENEVEVEVVGNGLLVGPKDCIVSKEKSSCLNTPDSSLQTESLLHVLQEENKMLKNELQNVESARKDADVKLQSTVDEAEALTLQLKETEQTIGSLQGELENLKDSKGMIEDQIENLKSINEDLDTQLTVAKAKLNAVSLKLSSLEVELEDKTNCCEELEATCLELQLELESVGKEETLNYDTSKERKQAQHGWEITATSAKLAKCQETTLDIGKQLKALTLPMEASVLDNQVTSTRARNFTKRFSLRDQMQAEDNAKAIILRSPNEETQVSSYNHSNSGNLVLMQTPYTYLGSKRRTDDALAGALAIVPSKKLGVGLFRRLLMRRKKGTSKKSQSLTKL